MNQETYMDERKWALDSEHAEAERYDTWLIPLSSGSLVGSIVFAQYLSALPSAGSRIILVISWAALLFSIFATMASFQFSQTGFRRYLEILDSEMASGERGNQTNRWIRAVVILNWGSLFFFIIGLSLLAVFCFLNLGW